MSKLPHVTGTAQTRFVQRSSVIYGGPTVGKSTFAKAMGKNVRLCDSDECFHLLESDLDIPRATIIDAEWHIRTSLIGYMMRTAYADVYFTNFYGGYFNKVLLGDDDITMPIGFWRDNAEEMYRLDGIRSDNHPTRFSLSTAKEWLSNIKETVKEGKTFESFIWLKDGEFISDFLVPIPNYPYFRPTMSFHARLAENYFPK